MRTWPAACLLLLGCASAPVPRSEGQTGFFEGSIIDFHAHVEPPGEEGGITPKLTATPEHLIAAMNRARVERSAAIVIARKGQLERTRAQNDWVLAIAQKSSERLFPIGSVHPDDGEAALTEMERLQQLGFSVMKLHPNTQKFDVGSPPVAALVKKAGELGLVLLFDGWNPFDADQTGKLAKLAIAYPRARMIIAHMGGNRFSDMLLFHVLTHYSWYARNVWFDLSAVSNLFADSPFAAQLLWVCRKIGTDRIVFGSDFPLLDPSTAVADVKKLGFTEAELRQIFYENAKALLGTPGRERPLP